MTQQSAAANKAKFVTGAVPTQSDFADFIDSYQNKVDNNWLDGFETGITAHAGGGQGSAYAITKLISIIATCANNNNSVVVATAVVGRWLHITNHGVAGAAVFPAVGENILTLSTNTALLLKPGFTLYLYCSTTGTWDYYFMSETGLMPHAAHEDVTTTTLNPDLSIMSDILLTAQASGLTINAPANAISTGDEINFIITDDGTSRAITWDGSYQSFAATLPLATVAGRYMFLKFKYNRLAGYWYLINYSVSGYPANPRKVYKAIVNQSSSSAPSATILDNSLGSVPVWSRVNTGVYNLTLASAFDVTKTLISITLAAQTISPFTGFIIQAGVFTSPNIIQITVLDDSFSSVDTNQWFITVEVF